MKLFVALWRWTAIASAVVIAPAFLFAAWGLLLVVQGLAQRNDNYAIFYAPVFAFALIGLLSTESWIKRLLATPVLAFLGRISYGMYLTHMIAIGERSGQLEQMLEHVAIAYESQVDARLSTLTSLLEPIMIVFMGTMAGSIALSILMPLMQINDFIQ